MSLGVVGTVSLLGTLSHWRRGNVNLTTAALFGSFAMAGAVLGARLSVLFSGAAQLVIFAVVMLLAAAASAVASWSFRRWSSWPGYR